MDALTTTPLWAIFITTVAVSLLAVEIGFRFGRHRAGLKNRETETSVGAMVGATLGLLAFMLAFVFGAASSRFAARKQLVLEDAIAVQTAYLRAELLPTPHAGQIQNLLEEYVELRVIPDPTRADLERVLARSKVIQDQIWARTVALGHENPDAWTVELFSQAVNELIDRHNRRVTVGLHARLPRAIWLALNILTIFAMCSVGYHSGLTSHRRSVAAVLLVIAFSVIMSLISDLDSAQGRLLRVNQQAMIDVQNNLRQHSQSVLPGE